MSRKIVLAGLLFGSATLVGAAEAQPVSADRYGAGPSAAAAPSPETAPAAMRGRMLSWPGKSLAPTYAAAPAPRTVYARPVTYAAAPAPAQARMAPAPRQDQARPVAYARPAAGQGVAQAYAGARPDTGAYGRLQAGREGDGWRPVYAASSAAPALAGPPQRAALPTSIYSPAPAGAGRAPPPTRTASADRRYGYDPLQDHSVHFYSVHRPFGLQPDPAPIPPQFFANTADLSEPAGPLPETRTTGSGSVARTVRAAPDTSVQ